MTRTELDELKQTHLGWIHNPYVSKGQLSDSKTIVSLIEEIAPLKSELREARECLRYLHDSAWSILDIYNEEIECRGDEDCDHCVLINACHEADSYLSREILEGKGLEE